MRPQLEICGADIPASLEASFWTLVKIDWTSGCWLWQGMTTNLYGRFKVGGTRYAAHRLAYALAYGYVPKELVVRHTCDVALCVAPHHLELGTDAQNIRDREDKKKGLRPWQQAFMQ